MLRRAVEDTDRKKARLVKQLEDRDGPDGSIFRAVRERLSELTALRLRVVFDGRTGDADCTVTVTDDTLTAVWGAVGALSGGAAPGP